MYSNQFGIKVSIIEPGFFKTRLNEEEVIRKMIQKGYDKLPEEKKEALSPDFVDKCKQTNLK